MVNGSNKLGKGSIGKTHGVEDWCLQQEATYPVWVARPTIFQDNMRTRIETYCYTFLYHFCKCFPYITEEMR